MRLVTAKYTLFIIIVFCWKSTICQPQEIHSQKNIKTDKASASASDFQFSFHNLSAGYYIDLKHLDKISRLKKQNKHEDLLPLLEEYVANFRIQNFTRDIHLLWMLGQLYENLDQNEKAVSIYRMVLKNIRGDVTKVLQQFDNWKRFTKEEYYVPLDTYYQLVEYRAHIDTLKPPQSVFLNMGELVNDRSYPDYGPTMNVANNKLIFTKRKKELVRGNIEPTDEEDLYYTINYDGFWDEAMPIGKPVNSGCNEGSATLSRDGKTLYFARCRVKGRQYDCPECMGSCDLYVSYLQDDSTWSNPENLGPNVNSRSWESQPSLSHSEDTLYFASDRLGGFGLSDIYYTWKQEDGSWAPARNMGPVINTRDNEVSPYYHPVHHVFYFSSKGQLLNFGDFDIYKSHKSRGSWQEPKNIGPLVNDKGPEYYFTIDSESENLFYAKAENTEENLDLFSFPLPMEAQPTATTTFKGSLTDSVTGKPFKGIVSIIDLDNGIEVAPKYIREDGTYEFDLINNNDYLLVITGDDFFRVEQEFHLNGDTNLDISTPSVEYKWKFESLEFDEGSADILHDMKADLNKVVDFMIDHPKIQLKISGHTDQSGNPKYNQELSQFRANSIKNYIKKTGKIDGSRITAKGYGSSKPIIKVEKNEADRKINRRVEFEIIRPEKSGIMDE